MRRAAFAAAVLGGFFGSSAIDSGGLGIASAEAKGYYTKKRVNGRWITGRFPKKSAAVTRVAARPAKKGARVAAVTDAAPEAPTPPARPETLRPNPPPVVTAAPIKATPAAPPADDDHMRKLQEALQARAPSLLVSSVADPAIEEAAHPRETASLGPEPGARSEPSSVTFDFKSGVKTTIYGNGAVTTEPFDVTSMKELAAGRFGARTR